MNGRQAFQIFLAICLFTSCNNASKTEKVMPQLYEQVMDWPKLPEGLLLGNPTGLDIDTSGNLLVFHRAYRSWPQVGPLPDTPITANTILIIDPRNGKLLSSWGDHLFTMPHGLTVDHENNVWVTDCGLNQVMKFTHEGKLLLKLGEAGVAGHDSAHFNMPTAVAIAKDGSFYVSDGYGNSRVAKFSADGKFLFEWGVKGNGNGEFDIPHGIVLDEEGNVYVADRENSRVQVFDSSGHFLKQWSDKEFGHICSIDYNVRTQQFLAVDDKVNGMGLIHEGSDLIIMDKEGKVLSKIGRSGFYKGHKSWYHDLAVDREGNVYIGDITRNTIQKFKIKM